MVLSSILPVSYTHLDVYKRQVLVRNGMTYKTFGTRSKSDYAVFVDGTDETAAKFAAMLALSLIHI